MLKERLHERRGIRLAAFVVACALMFAALAVQIPEVSADSTTDAIRDKIKAAEEEQERLQKQIENLQGEEAQSYANKQYYDQLAAATQNKIYLSGQYLTQLANQIEETARNIADLQATLDATMERYLERVRENYEDGGASYIELILGSESITDFLSRIERVNAILEYDRDLMKGYEENLATLAAKQKELEEMKKAEEDAKVQLEEDQAYYDQLSDAEAARMRTLQSNEEEYKKQQAAAYAAQQELAAELERIIAEYQRQQAAQGAVSYVVSGYFMRPIAAGVGYVSCVFGQATVGGAHRGYDIACAAGTPIMACANGTVITSGWHWSWGNYIVLDHGNGYTTLYAHCSALLVSAGQYVEQGQTIALVGNTGNSFGAHLHLECTYGGRLVDGAAAGIPVYG